VNLGRRELQKKEIDRRGIINTKRRGNVMKDLAGGFGTNQIENIRRKEKRCGGVTLPLFRLIGTALLFSPVLLVLY
jgi:hypothetical protein